jgi:hypothetical protein
MCVNTTSWRHVEGVAVQLYTFVAWVLLGVSFTLQPHTGDYSGHRTFWMVMRTIPMSPLESNPGHRIRSPPLLACLLCAACVWMVEQDVWKGISRCGYEFPGRFYCKYACILLQTYLQLITGVSFEVFIPLGLLCTLPTDAALTVENIFGTPIVK